MGCTRRRRTSAGIRCMMVRALQSVGKNRGRTDLAVRTGAHGLWIAYHGKSLNRNTPVEKSYQTLTPPAYKAKPASPMPTPQQTMMATPVQAQVPMMMNGVPMMGQSDMQLVMMPIMMGDGGCGVGV